jgi:hypothetical protein
MTFCTGGKRDDHSANHFNAKETQLVDTNRYLPIYVDSKPCSGGEPLWLSGKVME